MYTFVACYGGHAWYFHYCGVGKSLPRIANHVKGVPLGVLPMGVLPIYSGSIILNLF